MPKIWKKYSQKRNIRASIPISTFMCLWANYIFPRGVCLFCWRKYVDWSWEYINRPKTHECGNWGWDRAIPRKGIYKRNCRCSVGHLALWSWFSNAQHGVLHIYSAASNCCHSTLSSVIPAVVHMQYCTARKREINILFKHSSPFISVSADLSWALPIKVPVIDKW